MDIMLINMAITTETPFHQTYVRIKEMGLECHINSSECSMEYIIYVNKIVLNLTYILYQQNCHKPYKYIPLI